MLRKFFRNHLPIPLVTNQRSFSWILVFLSFLTGLFLHLSLTTAFSFQTLALETERRWTVEIPLLSLPSSSEDKSASAHSVDPHLLKIMDALQNLKDIKSLERLDHKNILSALKPWLGDTEFLQDTLLPILVDVTLKPDSALTPSTLQEQLRPLAAGVRVEPHQHWTKQAARLFYSLQGIIYFMTVILLATIMTTVHLMASSSVSVHESIVHILCLIGAPLSYISQQFEHPSFITVFKSSVIGGCLSIPIVILLVIGYQAFVGPLTFLQYGFYGIVFLFLPFLSSLLSKGVARLTVRKAVVQYYR
jgi:cell division transport system permease protein